MRVWDLPISPQTLVEQINREGAPWGLVGEYDEAMQRVFVCEVVPSVEDTPIGVDGTTTNLRRLCSVDDVHPFGAALANRISNHEAVRPQAIRVERFREAQERAAAAMMEAHANEVKAATRLKRRGGAMFYDGMGELLYRNRKQRRIEEAMRRQAGR